MIRQDYFMRMVQRLAQALAQALFHKGRHEFEQAEQELNAALKDCFSLDTQLPDLEQIIALCASEGGADTMVRLADVFAERGEIRRSLAGASDASHNDASHNDASHNDASHNDASHNDASHNDASHNDASHNDALALGLYLEVLHSGLVSIDLIQKTEAVIERTSGMRLPAAVLKRLLRYYEARGMLGRAEDVLYDWLDTKDPLAPEGGLDFYQRVMRQSDEDLARGGLSRDEIEQGLADWRQKTRSL